MLLADYGVLDRPAIFHNFFAENTLNQVTPCCQNNNIT